MPHLSDDESDYVDENESDDSQGNHRYGKGFCVMLYIFLVNQRFLFCEREIASDF